jgi:H+/Cl- antiporter ClcA
LLSNLPINLTRFFEYPSPKETSYFWRDYTVLILLTALLGSGIGLACSGFLYALDWVTLFRENNTAIIWFLPLAGLLIVFLYQRWGKIAKKGTNLLFTSEEKIPLLLAPLIIITTLLTHLFGGSAGREGTAIQMGTAFSVQVNKLLKNPHYYRTTLLICGISGGFAGLFGTPITGIVFGFEILVLTQLPIISLLPATLVAYGSYYICHYTGAPHTLYPEILYTTTNYFDLLWLIVAGISFGLTAWLYIQMQQFFNSLFTNLKGSPYLIISIGGAAIAVFVYFFGTKYIGLGIPSIQASFYEIQPLFDFLLKLLLTTFTLAIGFKGGEVTPLFFIGATLGNALFILGLPLPLEVLVGLGFVAVFAASTNTPLACSIMGVELFGMELGIYFVFVCYIAYFFSGKSGIYSSQPIPPIKQAIYQKLSG